MTWIHHKPSYKYSIHYTSGDKWGWFYIGQGFWRFFGVYFFTIKFSICLHQFKSGDNIPTYPHLPLNRWGVAMRSEIGWERAFKGMQKVRRISCSPKRAADFSAVQNGRRISVQSKTGGDSISSLYEYQFYTLIRITIIWKPEKIDVCVHITMIWKQKNRNNLNRNYSTKMTGKTEIHISDDMKNTYNDDMKSLI